MLTMRQEQVEAFRQHHLQNFEDQMVGHLQKFAPMHWPVIGEPIGREVIRLGIEQAAKYGFTNRGPVRFYIELMFMFGSYFDTDPQYPWIAAALHDPADIDQMVRADNLYDDVKDYWEAVAGPENEYVFQALRRLSQARSGDYIKDAMPLEECFLQGLREIYPQKCEYLGDRSLHAFIQNGLALAGTHGFSSPDSAALMVALGFFLGHGCTRDPLHGWIGRRLGDKRLTSADERSQEIHSKGMLYLNHVLNSRAQQP